MQNLSRLYFLVAIHCNPYHSTAPLTIILCAKCNICHCLYFTIAINITVICNIQLYHLQSFYRILLYFTVTIHCNLYHSTASPIIILSAKCKICRCLYFTLAINITVICSSAYIIYNNSAVFYRSNSLYSIIQQLHLTNISSAKCKICQDCIFW